MLKIRLNKFLVERGYCSRRQADRLIKAGSVRINNKIAGLGARVGESDEIHVDGNIMARAPNKTYIMLYKPAGVVTTMARYKGEKNVVDYINHKERIFPVGRLDKCSTGLLLLTNDGDLANKITHPRFGHQKTYLVMVNKKITRVFCEKMASGIRLDDNTTTYPCQLKQVGKNGFYITLKEGKNRQIKRMCRSLGYNVESLKRTRLLTLTLGKLQPGQWRELTKQEVEQLKKALEPKQAN